MSTRYIRFLSAVLFLTFPLAADQWNKKTIITFDQSVEIPGVVLPAGQYVFKLLDSPSNRHIVQVFNSEEDHVYATILAIPHYRMKPSDKTVILFEERAADQPQAIHAWFYPGQVYGQEFVYPKVRALDLAKASHAAVLSGDVLPNEDPTELQQTPVFVVTPENRQLPVAELEVISPAEPGAALVEAAERELPKTASWMPVIAMFGVGSLASALVLLVFRRRRA